MRLKNIVRLTFGAPLALLLAMVPLPRAAAQGPRGIGAGAAGVSEPPIPVITGVFSFQSTLERGTQTVSPEFDPIVLVPIGRKLLIESEFDMFMDLMRESRERSLQVAGRLQKSKAA